MKNKYLSAVLFIVLFTAFSNRIDGQITRIPDNQIIQTHDDSIIFNRVIKQFRDDKHPIGELMIAIGKTFEGTPYVAHTLENNPEERLIVNLRELDCTTFAENMLALARTIKAGQTDYETFLQNLQQIRYRDGRRMLYPSRLHYFSDWLYNNNEKQIISLPSTSCNTIFPNAVNFMSTHADKYLILESHPEFIGQMQTFEKQIATRNYYFIPKDQLKNCEDELQEGDIAGITTNIKGLDMVHTVLLTKVNGRVHILHASSAAQKVVLSDKPLADYLREHKNQTGLMVGRPISPAQK